MVDSQQLGKVIATARKRERLTQDELSDRAGLSYSTLAKIEQGNIKSPSVFTVLCIAQGLNMSVDDLLAQEIPKSVVQPKRDAEIKFVYSDVNGVLVRFFQRAFVSLAQETGTKPEVVETTFWHFNGATNKGEMSMEAFNSAMAQRLDVESVDWQRQYMEAIEPIVSMRHELYEISKKYPIGLLTNIMPGFVNDLRERKLLPDLDYAVIADSSVIGAVKPEDKMYMAAEEMAGFSGSEILFIDDDKNNLPNAEKFGWRVLWFDDYRPLESIARIREVLVP